MGATTLIGPVLLCSQICQIIVLIHLPYINSVLVLIYSHLPAICRTNGKRRALKMCFSICIPGCAIKYIVVVLFSWPRICPFVLKYRFKIMCGKERRCDFTPSFYPENGETGECDLNPDLNFKEKKTHFRAFVIYKIQCSINIWDALYQHKS